MAITKAPWKWEGPALYGADDTPIIHAIEDYNYDYGAPATTEDDRLVIEAAPLLLEAVEIAEGYLTHQRPELEVGAVVRLLRVALSASGMQWRLYK